MLRAASIALSAVLFAGSASAQTGTSSAVPPNAPDRSLGSALMWALVRSDGGLAAGGGAVTSTRVAKGRYQVVFERTLSGCGFTASATLVNIVAAVENTGFIVPNSATISLSLNGADVDYSVHMTVICTR